MLLLGYITIRWMIHETRHAYIIKMVKYIMIHFELAPGDTYRLLREVPCLPLVDSRALQQRKQAAK